MRKLSVKTYLRSLEGSDPIGLFLEVFDKVMMVTGWILVVLGFFFFSLPER